MLKIFIGVEEKQEVAYEVLKYSLEKHASSALTIYPLRLGELKTRLGFERGRDQLQTTEFTYSRFLVPRLCNYSGVALYMDSDMLCVDDVMQLTKLAIENFSLMVVKHVYHPKSATKMISAPQTAYPRKLWSSLMLLNCEQLRVWTVNAVASKPARWLHRFEPIRDDLIGAIPAQWNVVDPQSVRPKIFHFTEGGPWLTGKRDSPMAETWMRYREEWAKATS
jgi:hypothetical protein